MRILHLHFLALSLAAALPPYKSIVAIAPVTDLTAAVRHCAFDLSTTSPIDDGNDDFSFRLVAGLSGAGGVSFQSVNYGTKYICPRAAFHGALGIGDIGTECASAQDATWLPAPGLTDATNFSFTSASTTPGWAGLYMTQNASATCACCDKAGGWRDMVLARAGAGLSQTFLVGHAPPPPPAPPASLVVHADAPVDHWIDELFNGCHSDPGYTQEPLGWNADIVYGNAFQPSPASKISAWNDVSASTATGACALTGPPMNPNRPVPSLACTYTSGSGFLGFSNRGVGNEGFAFQSGRDYEGYLVVLAPTPTTLTVSLNDRDAGTQLAVATLAVPASAAWQRVPFSLVAAGGAACTGIAPGSDATIDCGNFGANPGHICVRCSGEIAVGLAAPGAASIGYVSLMPGTWGRFAGLPVLKSSMDAMQQMGIRVIRQGGTVSQSFKWKEWRGPAWNRTSMGHTWGDSLVGSWGLFEFVDMCNAADIKPVVTLAYDSNTASDWADLVEYLYGDASTAWGGQRIADGHPQPYFLDTLELGNEQENPDFVAQVAAMEARRAQIGAPELFYMYPTNQGVNAATAASLNAIPVPAHRIMPDCHVGGGGGIGCAQSVFAALPDYNQSFIKCVRFSAPLRPAPRTLTAPPTTPSHSRQLRDQCRHQHHGARHSGGR